MLALPATSSSTPQLYKALLSCYSQAECRGNAAFRHFTPYRRAGGGGRLHFGR